MFVKASSLLALAAVVYAQAADPSINTPAAVVQCQPAQITFTATRTPVFISIIPGGQPSAAPLQDLGQQNASPFTWVASLAQGTSITFQIRDSSGAVAYSAPITIQNSNDASCLGAQASTSAAATSAAATTSAAVSSPVASTSAPLSSAVASVSSVVSSAASSVSSVLSTATAPATTSRASSSAASVISTSRSSSASSAAASPTSANGAMPTAKVGIAGLLGLAAAVVMA